MTIKDLKDMLSERPDDTMVAYALWFPEDIELTASRQHVTLTEEEVTDTILTLNENYDAEYGITWEMLTCAVQDTVSLREET